jgi:hypothetical protein
LYSCLPHRVHLRRPLSPPTHEIGGCPCTTFLWKMHWRASGALGL